MLERFIKTMENCLKIVINDQNEWDTHIHLFLLAYRSAIRQTIGKTPANVLFGRELRLPADLMFGYPEDP